MEPGAIVSGGIPSKVNNDNETTIVDNDMYQEKELINRASSNPDYDVATVGNDIYSDVGKQVMTPPTPDDDVVLVDNDIYE